MMQHDSFDSEGTSRPTEETACIPESGPSGLQVVNKENSPLVASTASAKGVGIDLKHCTVTFNITKE